MKKKPRFRKGQRVIHIYSGRIFTLKGRFFQLEIGKWIYQTTDEHRHYFMEDGLRSLTRRERGAHKGE